MLEELEIRALGPLEHAQVKPAVGMTAITGETGAGKSMLLNALGLISGKTSSPTMVKPDQAQAWTQGIFDIAANSSVQSLLQESGVDMESVAVDGLFISRTVPSKGRSRAVINGRSVPRSVLANVSSQLLTIHGQSDQLRIAQPSAQRDFLDNGIAPQILEQYAQAWRDLTHAWQQLQRVQSARSQATARADYLRESIERITRVDPHTGEDEELRSLRSRIEHAADIARAVQSALAALDGAGFDDAEGARSLVDHAADSLGALHITQPFEQLTERLQSVSSELSDITYTLSSLQESEETSQDLDSINARIHELDELTRRWGPTLADVVAWKQKAQFELEDLDDSPERIAALQAQYEAAQQVALQYAHQLHEARVHVAQQLSTHVNQELAALAMQGASLSIEVHKRDASSAKVQTSLQGEAQVLDSTGIDDVEFVFKPFPGASGMAMGQHASGGELSRLMLALELAAVQVRADSKDLQDNNSDNQDLQDNKQHEARERLTFVFDEVDAGVGGRAAVELGKRLALLAQDQQVIVVTHLPQVAAWADRQYVVQKNVSETSGATTTVQFVEHQQREEEIARMLDGGISESSLHHARELLAQCTL